MAELNANLPKRKQTVLGLYELDDYKSPSDELVQQLQAIMKQSQQNKQAAQAQQQQALAQYDKAYGVCLEGKGYAVK